MTRVATIQKTKSATNDKATFHTPGQGLVSRDFA